MTDLKLSHNAQRLFDQIRDMDGVEWNDAWYDAELQELVKAGLVDIGPSRGPGKKWSRVVLKGQEIT